MAWLKGAARWKAMVAWFQLPCPRFLSLSKTHFFSYFGSAIFFILARGYFLISLSYEVSLLVVWTSEENIYPSLEV